MTAWRADSRVKRKRIEMRTPRAAIRSVSSTAGLRMRPTTETTPSRTTTAVMAPPAPLELPLGI